MERNVPVNETLGRKFADAQRNVKRSRQILAGLDLFFRKHVYDGKTDLRDLPGSLDCEIQHSLVGATSL